MTRDLPTWRSLLYVPASAEKFVAKAPAAVVEAERAKAAEWQSRLAQLRQKHAQL